MSEMRLPRLGRLSGAARFAEVLALRPCAKSAHFAAYHHRTAELSTGRVKRADVTVDGCLHVAAENACTAGEGPPQPSVAPAGMASADQCELRETAAVVAADAEPGPTDAASGARNPASPAQITAGAAAAPPWLLGLVVPKRFARRSVTRSLLKRQMRLALREHAPHLPAGAWVLRLRAPVQTPDERAAVTEGLRRRVQQELAELLNAARLQAGQPMPGGRREPRRAGPRAAGAVAPPASARPAPVPGSLP